MADVFISYASGDRECAGRLANCLEARGWTVWWDRKLLAGQSYDQVIEREIEAAKAVVVLWSRASLSSEWVKNEAGAAAERDALVPAFIDDVRPPLEFRRRQAANLVNWDGDPAHEGFRALCDGIAAKSADAGRYVSPLVTASPPQPDSHTTLSPPRRKSRLSLVALLGAIALFAAASVAWVGWGMVGTTQGPPAGAAGAAGAPPESAGVADAAVGTYHGDVISDSQGSSQTDVTVTITKLDKRTVRVTSDYRRLGAADVEITGSGDLIMSKGADVVLLLDLKESTPRLEYNPGGVAYVGRRR